MRSPRSGSYHAYSFTNAFLLVTAARCLAFIHSNLEACCAAAMPAKLAVQESDPWTFSGVCARGVSPCAYLIRGLELNSEIELKSRMILHSHLALDSQSAPCPPSRWKIVASSSPSTAACSPRRSAFRWLARVVMAMTQDKLWWSQEGTCRADCAQAGTETAAMLCGFQPAGSHSEPSHHISSTTASAHTYTQAFFPGRDGVFKSAHA